jgi:hypothetical protein
MVDVVSLRQVFVHGIKCRFMTRVPGSNASCDREELLLVHLLGRQTKI